MATNGTLLQKENWKPYQSNGNLDSRMESRNDSDFDDFCALICYPKALNFPWDVNRTFDDVFRHFGM